MVQCHFLTPKNYHFLKHFEKKCLYISVRKFLFQRSSKIFFCGGGGGLGGWWLNNFLKANRCLGLVKCYEFLILIKIFGNWTIFHTLLISIYHFPYVIHQISLRNNRMREKRFYAYIAASTHHVIWKEIENHIDGHNLIFRHICMYQQPTLTK